MNLLPGWNPGLIAQAAGIIPASYVFNGSDELLTHDWVTSSPGTTRFTISLWVKLTNVAVDNAGIQTINSPTNTQYTAAFIIEYNNHSYQELGQDTTADDWGEYDNAEPLTANDTWYHLLYVFDSPNGTTDDRIKLYVDGSLRADGGTYPPSLNEAHYLFTNGWQCQIGAQPTRGFYLGGKMAFIDVIDGLALAPTDFAFDDGGTWTAKQYSGSYGTYGFRLDGVDGFNDVSGNGVNFTGVNMTVGDNIDTSDLPPYSL